MKKSFNSKEFVKESYEHLQKRRKFIKRRSFLFAFFVLGVNIFAWFIFIAKANMSIDASVISWDVQFFDNLEEVNNVTIKIDHMYPGMPQFSKKIVVNNSSDMQATFDYKLENISVLGQNPIPTGTSDADILSIMQNDFPFSVHFTKSKSELTENDKLDFELFADWNFESESDTYYNIAKYFDYDASIPYYTKSGDTYNEVDVSEELYPSIKNNLYVIKDDADSLFGSKCKAYEDESGKACVQFNLVLQVNQKNA